MDTSETYIKMCDKAFKYLGEPQGEDSQCFTCGGAWNKKGVTLYRQDQLQEMLGLGTQATFCVLESYIEENNMYNSSDWGTYTWERLWLGIVMSEKYNKVWNGEDWIKEG